MKNGKYCILIADDEKEIRDILRLLLEGEGYAVLTAEDGREAIAEAAAEVDLIEIEHREAQLKMTLATSRDKYDYIFIDCPPSLGLITINALNACDTVLVPIQCEYFALEGLSQLMATVRQVKRLYNPTLEIEGIVLTMYDGRLNLTGQVVTEIKKYFADKLYKSVIPRAVRLSEAPSYGMPIQYYDKRSKGAAAYDDLTKEFLKKNRRR